MELHVYLESGWCSCGHHRDDGRRESNTVQVLTRQEIRTILGKTTPKDETK